MAYSQLSRLKYRFKNLWKIWKLNSALTSDRRPDLGQSILIVRLDHIGDMVLTTPLFDEIRRLAPSAHIAVLATPAARGVLACIPAVDEVIVYDAPNHLRMGSRIEFMIDFVSKNLMSRKWSIAINPRSHTDVSDESMLCFLSQATHRLGFSEHCDQFRSVENAGYDRFFTHIARSVGRASHERDRIISLAAILFPEASLVQPRLQPTEQDLSAARDVLRSLSPEFSNQPVVAFGIGASEERRMWPKSMFVETGRTLIDSHNASIVLIGGPGDAESAEAIAAELGPHAVSFAGKGTIGQSAAMLSLTDVFVGNDSGPMHIAAASGRPFVIEISCYAKNGVPEHINSPIRFGPVGPKKAILQPETPLPPCVGSCEMTQPHCISAVTVDHVVDTVNVALKEIGRTSISAVDERL